MHTIVGSATSGAALAAVLAIATASLGARPAAPQRSGTTSGAAPTRPRVQMPASPKVLDARLAQAKAEAKRLAIEQRTLLTRLRQIELAIETRELEREKTARARTVATAAVDAAVDRVAAADAELAALLPEVRARLARLYRLMPSEPRATNTRPIDAAHAASARSRMWAIAAFCSGGPTCPSERL